MPPIKRTKFKLAPEQLLEMFYWLKLIRAFDERLSILVKQGKVRSGVTELGIFGNTSMLGANLPVAAGLGFTFKMEKTDNVVVAYFGEGASNTGDFHEALNFAGVQQLPIVFVCENNQYAYSVPLEKSMAIDDVAVRAESYGFDGVAINGNDVLAVYQTAQGALARAGTGGGPTLIECKTYRWHGHSEHDKAFYRTDEELAMWKSRDPIPTFTTYLHARHVLDDQKQKEIEAKVAATIDEALEFAMNSPNPKPEDAVTDVYA